MYRITREKETERDGACGTERRVSTALEEREHFEARRNEQESQKTVRRWWVREES